MWVIRVVTPRREGKCHWGGPRCSEGWGGRTGEDLGGPPHGHGHEGADVTCLSSHPVGCGGQRGGSSPRLAGCLPVLWPSLPGAAREIL